MLIKREDYINKIDPFINKPIIKVITGLRRTGKSCLIRLIIDKLKENGTPAENVIYINKESLEFDSIRSYEDLYSYVKERTKKTKGKNYLFIDEVQEIEQWENAILSFQTNNIADIFITGSNSRLLSSDLSILLRGRYVEIRIFPLSFEEFLTFRKSVKDVESEFKNYLMFGGLPGLHTFPIENELLISEYLNKDNYPKLVLSLDKFYQEEYMGIAHKFLIDFLLEK